MTKAKKEKKEESPAKMGRPTKYKPEFCEMLIEHMSKGFSFESFAGKPEVRTSVDTLYHWTVLYKDFSDAKQSASTARLLAHEERADRIAAGGRGNATMQMFIMRTQHKSWQEKTHETQVTVNQTYEEYLKELEK